MDGIPDEVLCKIFSYLPVAGDLCRCACVCTRWNRLLTSSSELWKQMLLQYTPKEFRNDPLLNELPSPKAKLAAFLCAWSDEDHSENIYIKKNQLTMHRNPVAQSTDVIRAKVGFSSSKHYWLIIWHGPKFGSSAVVGVATKKSVLHGEGYYSLLGSDHESWGWDLSEGVLHYNGKVIRNYPQPEHIMKVEVGQKIGVILDMSTKTLAFEVNGKYLGIAFTGLSGAPLFPAVSAVYGNSEVSLVYYGTPFVG